MSLRRGCLALAIAIGSLSFQPVVAAPVVNSVGFLTDVWGPNTVPGFVGLSDSNRTLWNLNVTTGGTCAGVNVGVSRPGNATFSLVLDSDPIFSNCNFSRSSIPFTAAQLLTFAGSPNAWSYTVSDSSGSVSGVFPLIADPELLPLVSGIAASDASTTPLISWVLPDLTGFDIDRVRLRAIDAVTGSQVYQVDLASNATSHQIAVGALVGGRSYYYRVNLEDFAGQLLENRSNAFSRVAYQVPEPGSLALLGAGLAALLLVSRRRRV